MDNCLTNYLRISDAKLWFGLTLLRTPVDVEKYIVSIKFTVFYDNCIINNTKNLDRTGLALESTTNQMGFTIENLDAVNVLSFKTEIKVHETKRKQMD